MRQWCHCDELVVWSRWREMVPPPIWVSITEASLMALWACSYYASPPEGTLRCFILQEEVKVGRGCYCCLSIASHLKKITTIHRLVIADTIWRNGESTYIIFREQKVNSEQLLSTVTRAGNSSSPYTTHNTEKLYIFQTKWSSSDLGVTIVALKMQYMWGTVWYFVHKQNY